MTTDNNNMIFSIHGTTRLKKTMEGTAYSTEYNKYIMCINKLISYETERQNRASGQHSRKETEIENT
jgi:hypothetical protein